MVDKNMKKVFNICSHLGNANQNYINIQSNSDQNEEYRVTKNTKNKCWQGCGGERNSYT